MQLKVQKLQVTRKEYTNKHSMQVTLEHAN